jgi:hypothetical protein
LSNIRDRAKTAFREKLSRNQRNGQSSNGHAASNGRPQPSRQPEPPVPPENAGDAWEAEPPPKQSVPTRPQSRIETFTAADLAAMTLPEPKWAITGLVAEGLNLLCGKPKLGKSWLALLFALAVASGGVALGVGVDRGEALCLLLEDTKRRLQSRIKKQLSATNDPAPAGLVLSNQWPRQDQGGLDAIEAWLQAHPACRLVVIDTWQKFRPAKARGKDSYEEDYAHAAELKALADRYGVAVLALHHCRKLEASDPVDSVSGTLGLTGAADTVLVLNRARGQADATLFCTGRDLEERELALKWDSQFALWSLMGPADEYRLSQEKSKALDTLKTLGHPATPTELALLLDKTPNATKKILWRLAQDDWVKADADGNYSPKGH